MHLVQIYLKKTTVQSMKKVIIAITTFIQYYLFTLKYEECEVTYALIL